MRADTIFTSSTRAGSMVYLGNKRKVKYFIVKVKIEYIKVCNIFSENAKPG